MSESDYLDDLRDACATVERLAQQLRAAEDYITALDRQVAAYRRALEDIGALFTTAREIAHDVLDDA